MYLFSRRHGKAIGDKQLTVTLSSPLRRSLLETLKHFESYYEHWKQTSDTGWSQKVSLFDETEKLLLKTWGHPVKAFNEESQLVESNFEQLVLTGLPVDILDGLEAFSNLLEEDQQPGFQSQTNEAFAVHQSPWRMVDGQIFKIDSIYLEEAILEQAYQLLKASQFEGALDEFRDASNAYQSGDSCKAITSANNALESTMKTILGIQSIKPGELVRKTIDSGYIPGYYEGFLQNFEQILRVVSVERNQPGRGHGQGAVIQEVPTHLAELVLHLAGALIVFLVKHHVQHDQVLGEDDIPF